MQQLSWSWSCDHMVLLWSCDHLAQYSGSIGHSFCIEALILAVFCVNFLHHMDGRSLSEHLPLHSFRWLQCKCSSVFFFLGDTSRTTWGSTGSAAHPGLVCPPSAHMASCRTPLKLTFQQVKGWSLVTLVTSEVQKEWPPHIEGRRFSGEDACWAGRSCAPIGRVRWAGRGRTAAGARRPWPRWCVEGCTADSWRTSAPRRRWIHLWTEETPSIVKNWTSAQIKPGVYH